VHFKGHTPHSVRFDKGENAYVLMNAGAVHGVVPGTEFAVYASREDVVKSQPLCFFVVDAVGTTSSTMRLRDGDKLALEPLPDTAVAFQFKAVQPVGDLRVHVPDDERLQFVHSAIEKARKSGASLWLIEAAPEGTATLGVALQDNSVTFRILHKEIVKLGMEQLRVTVPQAPEAVANVLSAAAHFFWQLEHVPKAAQIRDKVAMHVYRLEETDDLDEDLCRVLRPVMPPFDLLEDREKKQAEYAPWKVVADDAQTFYGIEMQNNTNVGLFLSMFYLDVGTLEIRECLTSFH
jgi:hypothetical protein